LSSTIVEAGVSYFAIVFSAGFVLGLIRELWLVPALGVRFAELAEMPIMLIVIVLAARFIVRRIGPPVSKGVRVGTGLLALAILLLAELGLVLVLQDRSLGAYVASRDPVSGAVYLVMLGLFAAMPLLVLRKPTSLNAPENGD
jgi:hypothetical protein